MKFLSKLFGSTGSGPADSISFHSTQTCPECGSKLGQRGEATWLCPNLDCPAMLRERLGHWCRVMEITEIDGALVKLFVAQGLVYDPAELYRVKLKEIGALPGLTPERAQKIFDAIGASMKQDASRVLQGLSIPLIGEAEAQALARGFANVEAVFAAGIAQMVRQAGIPEAVAQSLARWYSDGTNRKLVKQLGKAGVNFESKK